MEARFDTETIRLINAFENITGAPVKDCLIDEEGKIAYFIVEQGKIGVAIGKNGNSVRHAERIIKKNIKVFEFSSDIESFVKNLIPQTNEIKLRNEEGSTIIEIHVDRGHRAVVIGRDGRNLKLFKELLQRNHNVRNVIIK